MALTATAMVQGQVARVSERTVPKKDSTTGEVWVFRNFTVIGDHTMAEVRVPDEMTPPKVGDKIAARVTLSAYKGDAELTLDAYIG